MARAAQGSSPKQRGAIMQVNSSKIGNLCQQNFNGVSDCFASMFFEAAPEPGSNATFNYTIRADQHLTFIDVVHHTSEFEVRILPLQRAIESAIIELDTGVNPQRPLEWPFTQGVRGSDLDRIHLSYIGLVQNYLVIVFFAASVGIAYHLAGAATEERESGIAAQMKAMGLLDSARVISWHLSLSLVYLPGWIVVAVLWKVKVFTETSVGILIVVHLLLGLSLASWSMFVMASFGKSPQLAAIVTMILSFLWVVIGFSIANVTMSTAVIVSLLFLPFFYPMVIRCICEWETFVRPASSVTEASPVSHLIILHLFIIAVINIFLWPWLGAVWESYLYDTRNPSERFGYCVRRPKNHYIDARPSDVAISVRNIGKYFHSSILSRKKEMVTSISDLTFDILKNGIFVLLGPNGYVDFGWFHGAHERYCCF
ncbi:hypothetical protein BN946_scf184753.g13 [Trametes cinnabarina]|uniref:ABC-2 type transporter transmembrane domain-containing protein n=1 Tax=Pycnoporus cinnabarinus TaxID=5643 RepID=A0A060SXL9_PYCCI|nr:hypothetical protein BN946_scf184753.g13 [Trametes cinnabarina]